MFAKISGDPEGSEYFIHTGKEVLNVSVETRNVETWVDGCILSRSSTKAAEYDELFDEAEFLGGTDCEFT